MMKSHSPKGGHSAKGAGRSQPAGPRSVSTVKINAKGQAELDGRERALLLKVFKQAIDRLDVKVVRQLNRLVIEAGLAS